MRDTLEAVLRASTLEDVWHAYCAYMGELGFDRLIYGYTRFATPHGVGELEDALFLTNHDPAYFRAFIDEKMFLDAPLTRWAVQNRQGSVSWGAVWSHAERLTERELNVIAYNQKMGVTAGYTVALPTSSPRTHALLALAGARGLTQEDLDVVWQENSRTIGIISHVTHLKIASLPIETKRTKLSRRQLEALEWVAAGKSNQDVATIMGVSVPTIEKHLRLAREKLGVDSTAQAVAKLTFLNQMYVRSVEETLDLNAEVRLRGDFLRR